MGCCKGYTAAKKGMAPLWSILMCLENLPVLGHLLALLYMCLGDKDKAERAALKATWGILIGAVSFPLEILDELFRKRSKKLFSSSLSLRPDWMRDYSDRTLRQLCLPASHQSGTFIVNRKLRQLPMVEGWSRCQSLSIEQQLMGGVRFFDFRLMSDLNDGSVWLHHNAVTCEKFCYLLDAIDDFVSEHPSEVVCIHIQCDGDITHLGRHVVVFNVPDAPYCWEGLHYHWPNKASPAQLQLDLDSTLNDLSLYNPHSMLWYKAEVTPNNYSVVRGLGGLPGLLVCGCCDEKFEFIEDMAAAANHVVLRTLDTLSSVPFNALSVDYVEDNVVQRIIELNDSANTAAGALCIDESLPRDGTAICSPDVTLLISPNKSYTFNREKDTDEWEVAM